MVVIKNWLPLIFLLLWLNFLLVFTPDKAFHEDLGRHLKLGQIISETRTVPKTNLFSFTMTDERFVNHHWFSEVIFWQVYRLGGLRGLWGLKISAINMIFACLYLLLRRKKSIMLLWLSLPLLAFIVALFRLRFDLRPELFSFLSLNLYLLILARPLTWRRILGLVMLQIFWTNTHIYFFIGPFIMAIFFLQSLFQKKAVGKHFLALLAIGLVPLINPNFLTGALVPLKILRDYGYSVYENQSIFFIERYFNMAGFWDFKIFFLIAGISVIYSLRRKKLADSLLAMMGIAFGLKMMRNLPLLTFLAGPSLFHNLDFLIKKHHLIIAGNKLNLQMLALFLFMGMVSSTLILNRFDHPSLFKISYIRLGEYLQNHPPAGRIFNDFDIGSFLIFKLYPSHQVFVDNRAEAYSKAFFETVYKPMQEDPAAFEKYAKEYRLQTIIWSKTDITPWARNFLLKILPQLRGWEKAYEDEVSVVYIRK